MTDIDLCTACTKRHTCTGDEPKKFSDDYTKVLKCYGYVQSGTRLNIVDIQDTQVLAAQLHNQLHNLLNTCTSSVESRSVSSILSDIMSVEIRLNCLFTAVRAEAEDDNKKRMCK